MNWLDPIKELYDTYSGEEKAPQIVEVADEDLDLDSELGNRPAVMLS